MGEGSGFLRLTGLGEEGAEAVVRVRGLALLSEVAIGLDSWSVSYASNVVGFLGMGSVT